MSDNEFITAHKEQSWGGYGHIGIEIRVAGFDLTDEMKFIVSRHARLIQDELLTERAKHDPKGIAEREQWRADLIACFPEPIYVERIKNGYTGDDAYGINRPWFCVTTRRGRITIGPRKRVIEIDWSESDIEGTAEGLFPEEQVTKSGRMIHAWGIEDAKRYVGVILTCAPAAGTEERRAES